MASRAVVPGSTFIKINEYECMYVINAWISIARKGEHAGGGSDYTEKVTIGRIVIPRVTLDNIVAPATIVTNTSVCSPPTPTPHTSDPSSLNHT